MISRRIALSIVAGAWAAGAIAQGPPGDIYFSTTKGSFKGLQVNNVPMKGTLTFSFHGTVLISRPTAGTEITTTGSVRLEKEVPKYGKKVYFGTGSITIKGGYDGVEFFGTNLKGEFHGNGFMRFYGEFDENGNTGEYSLTPGGKKLDWGTGGLNLPIPFDTTYSKPKVEVKPAKKGKG